MGLETVVISDVLEHAPGEPEAVTNFKELDNDIEPKLFSMAIELLKQKGKSPNGFVFLENTM